MSAGIMPRRTSARTVSSSVIIRARFSVKQKTYLYRRDYRGDSDGWQPGSVPGPVQQEAGEGADGEDAHEERERGVEPADADQGAHDRGAEGRDEVAGAGHDADRAAHALVRRDAVQHALPGDGGEALDAHDGADDAD